MPCSLPQTVIFMLFFEEAVKCRMANSAPQRRNKRNRSNSSFVFIFFIDSIESFHESKADIRNPLIYYVNRYFLMFGGSQVQKPYHASMNGFLTF